MRLPTQPRARRVSPARRTAAFAVLALALVASPATATRWTVDIGGSGDFTTIQAALDQQAIEFRDTVLVLPGVYAETIAPPVFGPAGAKTALVAAEGAAVTSMQSITAAPAGVGRGYAIVDGFTLTEAVSLVGHAPPNYPFVRCVFLSEMRWENANIHNLYISDCDFYGRTYFARFFGVASRLRFHGAPLLAGSIGGLSHFTFRDCTFEGPADTLVFMPRGSDEADCFERCTFADAKYGLVIEGRQGLPVSVHSSTFENLSEAGIWMDDSTTYSTWPYHPTPIALNVVDSRFERCGTAIHWAFWKPNMNGAWAMLVRDTVLASTGDGVVLGPSAPPFACVHDCLIAGSGGNGMVLLQNHQCTSGCHAEFTGTFSTYAIERTSFSNNTGHGLFVQDTVARFVDPRGYPPSSSSRTRILGATFSNNGGHGLCIEAPSWRVDSCTAFGNGGDGFSLRGTALEFANVARRNTSVLNRGDGFRLSSSHPPADSLFLISRNLAAMNVGAGIRVPFDGGLRHFAYNDAWGNYLAQYIAPGSPADSNLTVDPRFCDLGAGDLTLEQGSPCGPGGVYGLIGALPESCPNTLAVEPQPAGAIAFAVRPSVARGSVEFVPPATGGEGVVELFDLAGRVVWRAPLGPQTGAVRWHGEGEGGRVRAGLYWARFTNDAGPTTRRLAWLE